MSIRHRPDRGKWEVSAVIDGRRRRVLCGTKKQAQEIDTDLKMKRLGFEGIDKEYRLSEAFASYLATESKQKVDASYKADERLFSMALEFLKDRPVHMVRTEDLQLFRQLMVDKMHWTETTIAGRCKLLKAVFNKLEQTDRIKKNPAKFWKIPRGTSRPRRGMTREEFAKLIQVEMPTWLRVVLQFTRLTGARPVSTAALKWSDVDFSTARLVLRSRKGGVKKESAVSFPLHPELFRLLAQRRNESPLSRGEDFVFFGVNGKPLNAHRISVAAARAIKRAGLEGVVLYSLRHSLATDLIESGVSTEVAARLMGHSNLEQLKTYTKGISNETLLDSVKLIRGATNSELSPPEGTDSTNVIPIKRDKTAK